MSKFFTLLFLLLKPVYELLEGKGHILNFIFLLLQNYME